MYDPIDEKQAMEIAETVTEDDLIQPLQQRGLISRDCADRVKRMVREAFSVIKTEEIPVAGVEDETFWEKLQKLWGFREVPENERVTPMNAANLCPAPTFLIKAMSRVRADYNLNVAQQKRMVDPVTGVEGRRLHEMRLARDMVAEGLGLDDSDDIAIVRNASEGNNLINCGYRNWCRTDNPSQRDNVVIWDQNHPTNSDAWKLRAYWDVPEEDRSNPDKGLFEIRKVTFAPNDPALGVADKFIRKIDAKTRFVTFTETSNGNGFRIPENAVKRIWRHIQNNNYDCHVHIDATMTWGARAINLRQPYCHSLVSSAHKWFLGPKETGILYMSKNKVKNFMPSIFAYDEAITVPDLWDEDNDEWLPDTAQRFAMLGQRDDVNIINLRLAQGFWLKLAPHKPYDRVAYLADSLKQKLKNDWDLVTPEDMSCSWGVVRVRAPRADRPMNLYNWLYASNNGYRIAGSGDDKTFRLCPHIYNTMADIDRAVDGMNAWRSLDRERIDEGRALSSPGN